MGEHPLDRRFGQLAWYRSVHEIQAVHDRFGWNHPMSGDDRPPAGQTSPPEEAR
jgi:hypothetical protein